MQPSCVEVQLYIIYFNNLRAEHIFLHLKPCLHAVIVYVIAMAVVT